VVRLDYTDDVPVVLGETGMADGKMVRGGMTGALLRWASGLRFPYLVLITLVLFGFDLFIPDALPFADELIMGLVTLILASFRKRPGEGKTPVAKGTAQER
jgi:hypothetical protein